MKQSSKYRFHCSLTYNENCLSVVSNLLISFSSRYPKTNVAYVGANFFLGGGGRRDKVCSVLVKI